MTVTPSLYLKMTCTKVKETIERGDAGKKKFVRRTGEKPVSGRKSAEKTDAEPKTARTTPKRVRVISKKDLKKD